MSLNTNRFISLLRKLSEQNIVLPVLADIIEGQIQEGNIQVDAYNFKKSPFGIYYNLDENKIIINPITIDSIVQSNLAKQLLNFTKNKIGIMKDSSYVKGLSRSHLGILIGTLLYHGIHIYNRHNRGDLIKYPATKKWYLEFIFRCIYYFSNGLTTMPRQAAMKIYFPYLWLIFEKFEVPMYHNLSLSDKKIENILGNFLNFSKTEIYPKLAESGLDQPSLDVYSEWLILFSKELKIIFYNQDNRISTVSEDVFKENELKAFSFKAIQDAYSLINTTDVLKFRFPSPFLRELFITSEPLAQSLFAEYLDGKASGYEEWQKISARGLSLLG